MKRKPPDPHHDAPELFPTDVWDDSGLLARDTQGSSTILPPRRTPAEKNSPAPDTWNHEGIRIESSANPRRAGDDDSEFKVRKIDGTVIRLEPEEPSQPRMPRQVVFHEQPPEQARETESEAWGSAKKFSSRWIAGISIGIATLVIAAISLLPLINRSNSVPASQDHPSSVAAVESAPGLSDAYDDLITRPDEAMKIFGRFMTAPLVDDFLPVIRNRIAVEPLIRSSQRVPLISKQWTPEEDSMWGVHQSKETQFARLIGKLPDDSEFYGYFVLEDRHLLLDWKATTGYGTATFKELAQNQGNPAEIRGTLRPSEYYSIVFPEDMFQCYLFDGPDQEDVIWCYTRHGTSVDREIQTLFVGGAILKNTLKPRKVTLRLERAPDGAFPNQWLIEELLHNDWISP